MMDNQTRAEVDYPDALCAPAQELSVLYLFVTIAFPASSWL
jgi:hypothetical protein